MATRLYPGTKDVNVLAKLAGVEPAVYAEAEALESALKVAFEAVTTPYDAGFAAYVAMKEATLDHFKARQFQIFGWGRMKAELSADDQACGHTTDAATTTYMLSCQGVTLPEGVTLEDLGGLQWG